MTNYKNREQTEAKHFILRGYLQELAFKVLNNWDIVYVDGFSGPWKSTTSDYSDTSFMIALSVLKDAQNKIFQAKGIRRTVKCFFSEKSKKSYAKMVSAVSSYNNPNEFFEIRTYHGKFVDAVAEIKNFMGQAFPLIFIDPTGWTEYPFDAISPLFSSERCEVLINFMYDHVNRFVNHSDPNVVDSLNPILGGPGWQDRLDKTIKKGPAVEKLFRQTLKNSGNFQYVVSTKIDKSVQDRPHFFLAYGTKNRNGLKAFRKVEYAALCNHARNRSAAKNRQQELKRFMGNLFAEHEANQKRAEIDNIVAEQKKLAKERLLSFLLERKSILFSKAVDTLLQVFMLRETNIKDICVELEREGKIQNTWGHGNRKPDDETRLILIERGI